MPSQRDALRRELREKRRNLAPQQRISAADGLASALLGLPFAPTSGYVAGYWATDGEIALHSWQLKLPPQCVYCLPMLHDDGRLRFAPWRPGDPLVTNRYGIPEPDVSAATALDASQMALVAVPLVGFDASGHRLGMGGGWYDRSFAFRQRLAPPPWLVGVGFDAQQIRRLEPATWDVALDAVCTETTAHDCRSPVTSSPA